MRILIADDDVLSRRMLELTLQKLGHEVIVVADGAEALQQLSVADSPRLAILDWVMPELDGLEVCRYVRKRQDPYVYVILLTAKSEHKDIVTAFDADVDDFLGKPFDASELRARLRSGARILELQEGLLRSQEELRRQATHDHLTGTLTRRAVVHQLDLELRRATRDGSSIAVLLADLDHFKHVNDAYGHSAGDAVLLEAAARMRSVLRGHEAIGRYGGEEFLIVLPDCGPSEAASVAARACLALSTTPIEAAANMLRTTMSVGVATAPIGADSARSLVDRADQALYRAKAAGRNRVGMENQTFMPSADVPPCLATAGS
ncbi:MAG TPA: diguanylate cyclase [Vicinamibacterales bacterium]|nr:diguanylate cyclase [Vicinamibacterales bacterium]